MKNKIVKFGSITPSIVILVSIVLALILFNLPNKDAEIPVVLRIPFVIWLVLLLISVVLVWILIIGYIIHILAFNKSLSSGAKFGWSLMIWFFNIVSIPIYCHKYINIDNIEPNLSTPQALEDNGI